jgi:hypothetical protein
MGQPTAKVLSMHQRILKHMLEEFGRYVVRQQILAGRGREPPPDDERLTVTAVFPDMVVEDTTKYAAALAQVASACVLGIQRGLMTETFAVQVITAVAGRLGVEAGPQQMLDEAREEAAARAEADTIPGVAME